MKNFLILTIALIFFAACRDNADIENLTPTNTFQAYVTAIQKKDVNAFKQTLSKNTVQMMESNAKEQKISLDEAIKNQIELNQNKDKPEIRNEKIDGETATIEVKNSFGGWEKIPFVKEDRRWKIALDKVKEEFDKLEEESKKKLDEEINKGKR